MWHSNYTTSDELMQGLWCFFGKNAAKRGRMYKNMGGMMDKMPIGENPAERKDQR